MDYELMQALRETIIMILIPTLVSIIFGLPIGACIYLKNSLSIFCNIYVNVVRSVPYLLFVIILIPLTRLLFFNGFWGATCDFTFVLCGSCNFFKIC